MKTIELNLPDEVYESLRSDAERMHLSVAELVIQRAAPRQATSEATEQWSIKPVAMGPFKIPPEKWREFEDEGRTA